MILYMVQRKIDGKWEDWYTIDNWYAAEYVHRCLTWNMRKDLRVIPDPTKVQPGSSD